MLLANLSWEETREYLAQDDRIIFPIGATEQHGRHLGLGCDYILAEAIANETGARANVVVAPALAFGMSHHHLEFRGTLSLSPSTLTSVLEDLFGSLYRHGFRRVLVVNGHGGNSPSLSSALASVTTDLRDLRVKTFQWWTAPEILKMVEATVGVQQGTHASNHETAFLMAVRADAVKRERIAKRDAPVIPSYEFTSAGLFAEKYPDGVMGLDPTPATRELGEKIFDASVAICQDETEKW